MRPFLRVVLSALLVLAGVIAIPAPAQAADFSVLVFSKTAGFRHGSIGPGITAIQQLGAANNFTVEATEDAGQFTDANLARFNAVIWLSTTGDVLNATQQAAFERYIARGRRLRAACTPRPTPNTTGPGTATSWAPTSSSTPPSRPPPCGSPTRCTLHRPPAAPLEPVRRVVQLPRQPARQGPRAGHPRRDHLLRWRHGHRPPDLVVPERRGRPLLVHGHGAHRRLLQRRQLPQPPARRHPDRVPGSRRPTAARR